MGLTYTNADSALKEDYLPAMREQLNNSCKLLAQIESNSEDIEGRRAVLSLHVRRSSGIGARPELGTLPTAGSQGYTEERVDLFRNYGRIQVSGPIMRAMKSDNGSFVRAVDSETKGIVKDLRKDVNRQYWGTSDGVIAACGTTTSSTTVVLATTVTDVQLRELWEGMTVDIGTGSPFNDVATSRTINSVDFDAKTIVISGAAVTTDSNDRIVRAGNGGSGADQLEVTGLQTIVSDSGTLHNVNPSTYSVWKSKAFSNSGTLRAATENLFAKAVQQGSIASGGEEVNVIFTSDGVHRNYAAQLQGQKRTNDTLTLPGGYKAISITAGESEVGLTWEEMCPSNKAFGLGTMHLKEHKASDWEWMDEDGAVLSRVSGVDAYEATLFKYHELATDQRNAHFVISDLTES